MDHYQIPSSNSSSSKYSSKRKKKVLLFLALALLTLALAVVWAIYDAGWYIGPWGKLAFVALTWFSLVTALYKLFFTERA